MERVFLTDPPPPSTRPLIFTAGCIVQDFVFVCFFPVFLPLLFVSFCNTRARARVGTLMWPIHTFLKHAFHRNRHSQSFHDRSGTRIKRCSRSHIVVVICKSSQWTQASQTTRLWHKPKRYGKRIGRHLALARGYAAPSPARSVINFAREIEILRCGAGDRGGQERKTNTPPPSCLNSHRRKHVRRRNEARLLLAVSLRVTFEHRLVRTIERRG